MNVHSWHSSFEIPNSLITGKKYFDTLRSTMTLTKCIIIIIIIFATFPSNKFCYCSYIIFEMNFNCKRLVKRWQTYRSI